MRLFGRDFQRNVQDNPPKCRTLQRGIRMLVSFSEILVMGDVG